MVSAQAGSAERARYTWNNLAQKAFSMNRYLQQLTTRLSKGLERLPEDFRDRQSRYLLARQNADGGFSGREGGSDLYYTGFALRGLAALDALSPDVAKQTAAFLSQRLKASASIVDFYSLLYAALLVQTFGGADILANSPLDWPDRVAVALETFRTPDGGYAKAAGAASGSTYHTFLVGMVYELLGRCFPAAEAVLRFVASRRRDDSGYVEIAPMRRSGTNPTAAALGIVQLIRGAAFDPAEMAHVADFLAEMASLEGGLCANSRIPAADLLSTFTGAWTLAQLNALDRINTAGALAYAESLAEPEGGFRGGVWDEGHDCEYTFYGMGTLALLTS
jgi:geranylgeranyl transferase type-2 subunit beta